jgi:hypothetical protein
MQGMIREHFDCECSSPDHQVIFTAWEGDSDVWDEEMFVHVSLNESLPWYKRVREAVRYVFGLPAVRWHYDDVVLNKDKAERMRAFLDKFIQGRNNVREDKEVV